MQNDNFFSNSQTTTIGVIVHDLQANLTLKDTLRAGKGFRCNVHTLNSISRRKPNHWQHQKALTTEDSESSCNWDSNEKWAMFLKKLDSNQRPMKHFGCCRQWRLAQIMMKNYSDSQNYLSAVFARFGEPKSLLFDNERKVFQNDLIDHRKTQVMRIM